MKKEDPAVTAKRVDNAKALKELVTKANGNFDSLSAEDKAKLNGITGSEEHSRTAISKMGGGGVPPSGGG